MGDAIHASGNSVTIDGNNGNVYAGLGKIEKNTSSVEEIKLLYELLLVVIKNNIIRRALEVNGESGLNELLEGPTAIVYGTGDYLEPAKIIYNFSKDNDFYKIKGGIIDGKVMTAEEIITLAKLPSKETLLSMLAGALLGTISKFAVALDQVRIQKEANA